MALSAYHTFIIGLMIITGSINTLSTKWADKMRSVGSDGIERDFNHPFVQTCGMFLGEISCLLVFKAMYLYYFRKQDGSVDTNNLVKGNRQFNPFLLYVPALCDMTATSLMYFGLTLTYASSFQMLRGSVIVFVGLLSMPVLNRSLAAREWIGILLISFGLMLVGLSDFLVPQDPFQPQKDTNSIITGDMMIVIAQSISAVQMVLEEKFVSALDIPPLQTVGWEGVFGFMTLGFLLIPFNFISVHAPFGQNASGVLEDLPDALVQIKNNPALIVAILGNIISIAFFNFAGVSVTKELSATTRMILDSVRTLVIWLFSLMLHWQPFHFLQPIGFAVLLIGMAVYKNVAFGPYCTRSNDYEDVATQDGTVINRSATQT